MPRSSIGLALVFGLSGCSSGGEGVVENQLATGSADYATYAVERSDVSESGTLQIALARGHGVLVSERRGKTREVLKGCFDYAWEDRSRLRLMMRRAILIEQEGAVFREDKTVFFARVEPGARGTSRMILSIPEYPNARVELEQVPEPTPDALLEACR